jgi:hypothetical protein
MRWHFPSIALIWVYSGNDRPGRRREIQALDYPEFEIVEVAPHKSWSEELQILSPAAQFFVIWMDDGKPVKRDFLQEMTLPLSGRNATRAKVHFWSGNALAIPRALMTPSLIMESAGEPSLMKLMMPAIDSMVGPDERIQVAFSSTERLAPLYADPTNYPC